MHNRLASLALLCLALLPALCPAAQFTLTWTDNSTNERGFIVERADGLDPAEDAWQVIATTPADAVAYVDAGLPNSAAFSYRLAAYNDAGPSGYSNTASGTTPPSLPAAPTQNPLTAPPAYQPPAPTLPPITLQAGQSLTIAAAPSP